MDENTPVSDQIENLFAGVDMDFSAMAIQNRKLFQAHKQEGFNDEQALDIVKCLMSTHLQTRMIIDHQEAHPDGTA